MNGISHLLSKQWTRAQALLLAAVCLAAGIAGGWSIHRRQGQLATRSTSNSAPSAANPAGVTSRMSSGVLQASNSDAQPSNTVLQTQDASQLKAIADRNAAPLLAQLKSDPANAALLTSIGNLYYDAKQYSLAVGYYERALKSKPSDVGVRTDMGTAYWFLGDADRAISEFDKALSYEPTNPNTLFNLGIVKWKGKQDAAGAIADWQKLLKATPSYQERDQVEKMIAAARQHAASPGN